MRPIYAIDPGLTVYLKRCEQFPLLKAEEEIALARNLAALIQDSWRIIFTSKRAQKLAPKLIHSYFEDLSTDCIANRGVVSDQFIFSLSKADVDWTCRKDFGRRISSIPAEKKTWEKLFANEERIIEVRNTFLRANLRLPLRMAAAKARGGYPLSDLLQEATFGLMVAIQRFDPDRGIKFSTYAVWWIRHWISRAITAKYQQIRLPQHIQDRKFLLAKARRELTATLGRIPTREELALGTGVKSSSILHLETYNYKDVLSLEEPIPGDREEVYLRDVLQDTNSDPVDSLAARRELLGQLQEATKVLTANEQKVLALRFGQKERTLREVGEELKISRERVRQIQVRALEKLRELLGSPDA